MAYYCFRYFSNFLPALCPSCLAGLCVLRFGSVRFGPVRFGLARSGSARFGPVRVGSVRFRSACVWFGAVPVRLGLVWSGPFGSVRVPPARFWRPVAPRRISCMPRCPICSGRWAFAKFLDFRPDASVQATRQAFIVHMAHTHGYCMMFCCVVVCIAF